MTVFQVEHKLIDMGIMIKFFCKQKAKAPFFILVLLLYISFFQSSFASEPERDQPSLSVPSKLIIAGDSDYAPMEFLVNDGKARGIFVDIWRLWSSKTGIPIEYRCMSMKDAASHVQSGKADVLSGVLYTDERAAEYVFTKPYFSLNTSIFFHKSVYGVKELKDLAGFRVGFVKGDDFAQYLSDNSPSLITVMFDSYEGMIRAAVSGEIRAFVCDLPVGLYFLSKLDGDNNFRFVKEPVYKSSVMAAVRKDNAGLAYLIEKGFSQISDKEIQAIVNRWTGGDASSFYYWRYIVAIAVILVIMALLAYLLTIQVRGRIRKAVKSFELRNKELCDSEKKSRESEERYRTLAENSTDFIIRFDSSLKIVYANPGASLITECDENRLFGKTVYEIGLPSSLSMLFANAINSALNIRERQRLDFQTGSGLWLDCLFIPEVDGDNDSVTVLVTGRDITEIKRIEEELRENEAKFRSLVENTPGAVYRCRKDNGWNIEFVSEAIEEITGYPSSVFLGKGISAYRDIIHADDQAMIRNTILEAFFSGRGFVAEYRIRHSTGLYRWVYESGQGAADNDGEITLIDGVIIDITEQRQAEEQMWQLRKFLKNIIDSMPSAIIGVDPAGRITQWNKEAEKLSKFSADFVIGKRFFDIFPDLGFGMDNVRQAILNRAPGKYSKISLETDSMKFLADITVYPLVSNGAEGAVIRVDDVTDKVRMEEIMIQSEKMLSIGGLAAGMAHEINNPLAAIIQNMQVIKSRLVEKNKNNEDVALACGTDIAKIADYSERRNLVKMIDLSLASGQRAASIVENMLSFSRKESARTEPADISDIIEKTLELAASDYDLKKSYDFRKINIVRDYQQNMPAVPCEKNKMQQVFLNIFRNGAQAMFESGKILDGNEPEFLVRLYVKRKMACIEIKDNGPGMDEETRKKVFEPFFTTKPVGQGTGLGLSLAYFIVTENHGGFMEAESEPGRGCKIIVRLPMSK